MRIHRLSPVVLLLAAGASLYAQEVTGTITGKVTDSKGAPVANAVIRVRSDKTLSDRTITTNAEGEFRLPMLMPGVYSGTVGKDGYVGSKAEFRITGGGVIRQNFVLRPIQTVGAVVEVVAATSAAVDKTQTKTASVQTTEQLETIPTAGNYALKALAALDMSPGVSGANPYYAAVRGGAQGQTQYLVNGLSVRDNITSQGRPHDVILDDLVEESQIILSPLNAKYGDSSAGMVNMVEKTGSNEFSGTVRVKLDKDAWTATRPIGRTLAGEPEYIPEPVKSDALSRSYELSISGPIIKDRLTFTYGTRLTPSSATTRTAVTLGQSTYTFFNGQPVAAHTFDSGLTRTIPEKFSFHQARLFWQITPEHTLDYSHSENTNQYADWGNGANTNGIDASLPDRQFGNKMFRQITYRGLFFGNQTLEVRYGAMEGTTRWTSGPGDPVQLRWLRNNSRSLIDATTTGITNGSQGDSQIEERNTYNLIANYSAFFDLYGSHNVDFGFNQVKTVWGTVQNSGGPNQRTFSLPGRVQDGRYIVFNYNDNVKVAPGLSLPGNVINYYEEAGGDYRYLIPQMTEYIGVSQAELTKPVNSLYFNDLWSFNDRYSLMFGVRYDQFKYNDGKGERYNSSTISPRAEFTWDIGGDNARIVKLSWGQFRGNVHERYTRTFSTFRYTTAVTRMWNKGVGQGDYLVPYSEAVNPGNYGQPFEFDVPDALYDIDKKFKPDMSAETSLGYRRSYASGASVVATLVHRKWSDLAASIASPDPILVQDPTGGGLAPIVGYGRKLVNDPSRKREYMGFELEFKTPLIPNTLWLSGAYSYGRTTGNNQMQDSTLYSESGQRRGTFYPYETAMGISMDNLDPVGQLGTSSGNVMRLMLMYVVKVGSVRSTVSLSGRYNEGTPFYNPANSVNYPNGEVLAPNVASYTHFYYGRGQYGGIDTTNFDFSYNVEVPLTKKIRFFSTLAVVNVFNSIRPNTSWLIGSPATQVTPTGYKIKRDEAYIYGACDWYGGYYGARDVNFDIGIRF